MDRICRILWPYLWCGLLLCLLSIAANSEAATRKLVKLPSKSSVAQNPSLPPNRSGDSIQITGPALEGEFLPGDSGTKGVPIKVLPRLDGSLPRMFNYAKNGMKGGAIGIAGSVALGVMLDQIEGFIDEAGNLNKPGKELSTTLESFWCVPATPSNCRASSTDYYNKRRATPSGFADDYVQAIGPTWRVCSQSITSSSATQVIINIVYGTNCSNPNTQNWTLHRHGTCKAGFNYDPHLMQCVQPSGSVPLDDADYDLMFDYANQQNSEWLHGLLKDVCKGSNNPSGCFDEMLDRAPLAGPSSVNGPTTTKTTTTTGPDGITSQTVTTTNTKYDITYGDNYYDYRKTETTKTEKDGQTESETTETEPEEVEQEENKEEEKEEDEPSPCEGSNCDGPAYEDQYEPEADTKEDYLGDYVDRVSNIPIITAVSNLFSVSVGGSCPVWEYHGSMPVMGTSMQIDLVFDFFCMSWVLALGPWLRAAMLLLGTYGAIRIALL